jgi:hypothetical protein
LNWATEVAEILRERSAGQIRPLVLVGHSQGANNVARSAATRSGPASLALSPEQRRSVIQQSMDKHYRRMLDEPVPMLGNRSPRKAVKTDVGREKVVAWLKMLENHSANIADPNDPMATYDFSWLWVELGVSALRR